MSAAVLTTKIRIARQFTLAVILCAAVAGGAAVAAAPTLDFAPRQMVADGTDNNWPVAPVAPVATQDNNWPVAPVAPTVADDNNRPNAALAV